MDTMHIGSIITGVQNKDAVHMAVAPIRAACVLKPGDHVALDEAADAVTTGKTIGIVDPFLRVNVKVGEFFWLFLYPGSITSLRHDWNHPAFEPSADKQWLIDFAQRMGLGYETLMDGADTWVQSREHSKWGEYLCLGGLLEGCSVPAEFWPHYEAVRGISVPADHQENFFTCSCS